jgi:hypothetical protein
VSGTCNAGLRVSSVNQDGSVDCVPCGGGIPSGMIAIFDTACPLGWTRLAALDGRVPRGAASYGGTGGGNTHFHDIDPPFTDTNTAGDHQHTQGCGAGIRSGAGVTQPAECG